MSQAGVFRECWVQIVATILGTLTAVSNGMSYGWTAPIIPYLMSEAGHISITQDQGEHLETTFLFGTVLGLPLSMYSVNRFGRKRSMIFASLISCICWIIIWCTYDLYVVYVARLLSGVAANMEFIGAPMYIAEIAEPRIRGFLGASVYTMFLLGFVIIYPVGALCPFYVVPLIGIILTSCQVIFFPFMPESPYYYVYTNRNDEASKALTKLRSNNKNIDKRIVEMKIAIQRQKSERGRLQDMFRIKSNRNALLIMLLLNTTEHCVGISVILMNLHQILQEAGSIYMSPSIAAIIFAVVMLVAVIVASMIMDKFGRKFLLITSGLLTGLALLVITIYLHLKHVGYDVKSISWIPIACVMSYAATFKWGLLEKYFRPK